MTRAILAAVVYFTVVFGLGFTLGVLRALVVAPRTGELVAVALELPIMVLASWLIARRVVAVFQIPDHPNHRLAMGAIAFLLLMSAEIGLAAIVFGLSPDAYLSGLISPAGALGLAGQAAFALMPWLLSSHRRARSGE